MTEKTDPTSMSGTSVSRRKLLLGGAVVTGAVWVAPAVESITSVAAASTSTPTGVQAFSYVTVLLAYSPSAGTTDYYRLKFDLATVSAALGSSVSVPSADISCGSATDGFCFTGPNAAKSDPTLYSAYTGAKYDLLSPCPTVSAVYQVSRAGTASLIITLTTAGGPYTLVSWVVHQGHCCAWYTDKVVTSNSNGGPPTYTAPTVSGSTITFDQLTCPS